MAPRGVNTNRRQIVVGFDGSPCSERALTWAIDEAQLRGVALLVVHALDNTFVASAPVALRSLDAVRDAAQLMLDRGVQRARAAGIEVQGVLDFSDAAAALVRASEGADLLVVGSRGLGGLRGALLGSVSTACVHHATCPVLVVPPPNRIEHAQAENSTV